MAPLPGLAGDVPGAQDDAFGEAVALWLADDEAEALPRLAGLAHDGNAAAQVLIALIDKSPALQGPWLTSLSRAERVDLMRMAGGLSGRSWMHAATGQTPLAELWLRLWAADAPAALALEFVAAGEARAARMALIFAAKREAGGIAALVDAPGFPPGMQYLAWHDGAVIDSDNVAPGDPQRRNMGLELDAEDKADWLATAPEAVGPRVFCETRCPASARSCMLAVADALGAHGALLSFGSPSERLIDAERFAASDRGQTALLRRVSLSTDARGRRHLLANAEAADACFASQLLDEIERYRTPVITVPLIEEGD